MMPETTIYESLVQMISYMFKSVVSDDDRLFIVGMGRHDHLSRSGSNPHNLSPWPTIKFASTSASLRRLGSLGSSFEELSSSKRQPSLPRIT